MKLKFEDRMKRSVVGGTSLALLALIGMAMAVFTTEQRFLLKTAEASLALFHTPSSPVLSAVSIATRTPARTNRFSKNELRQKPSAPNAPTHDLGLEQLKVAE